MRPLCKCGCRPAAINYIKNGKTYYRKLCETCLKNGLNAGIPRWKYSGYVMKNICDKCGFKSPYKDVFNVYHVDGNLNNNTVKNLKTVCLNCTEEIKRADLPWRPGDLAPDL